MENIHHHLLTIFYQSHITRKFLDFYKLEQKHDFHSFNDYFKNPYPDIQYCIVIHWQTQREPQQRYIQWDLESSQGHRVLVVRVSVTRREEGKELKGEKKLEDY